MQNLRFTNKVVMVTGASRGIGRAIAGRFLIHGATVISVQRSKCDIDGVIHFAADLFDEQVGKQVMDKAMDRCGGIDVLVNNAGVMFESDIDKTTMREWERTMAVNLRAPFGLIKHAAPIMKQRGGGAIINIGSIEGLGSNPRHAAYCASKAGLHGLTRAVAVDLGAYDIRCNAVAPGWIETDLNVDFVQSMSGPETFKRRIGGIHPLNRTGKPEEVASLVVWLASEDASFITGQVYTIDGGRMSKLSLPSSS